MGIQVQPCCCKKWYALSYNGWLLDFDPSTVVLSNPRQTGLRATYDRGFTLQWNPRDNCLYTIVWTLATNKRPALVRIKLDGTTELAATGHSPDPNAEMREVVSEWTGLAIDGNGRMIAAALTELVIFTATPHLFTFDPGGLMTRLPAAINNPFKALDFDDDGTLWAFAAENPTLHTINPVTGASTSLGSKLQHSGGLPAGMAYDEGRLYLLAGAGNIGFEYYEIASDTRVVLAAPQWPVGVTGDVVSGLAIAD